ncbi:MAG: hypothetical protein ABIO83_08730, partial [Ilumatobacteraceae bacterium]
DERMTGGTAGAVQAAIDAGVATMVTVGCDRATSLAAIAAAADNDAVFRAPPPPEHLHRAVLARTVRQPERPPGGASPP